MLTVGAARECLCIPMVFVDLMKSELRMSIAVSPTEHSGEIVDMGHDRFRIIESSILPSNDTCANKISNSTSPNEMAIPSIVIVDDNGITKVDELSLDGTMNTNKADINLVDTQSNKQQAAGAEKRGYTIKSNECLNSIIGGGLHTQRRGSFTTNRSGSSGSSSQHHVTFSLSHEQSENSEINNNQRGGESSCENKAGKSKVLRTIEVLGVRTEPPDAVNRRLSKIKYNREDKHHLPRHKRLTRTIKMEENHRSNSNPDQLHFTLDETTDNQKLRRSTSLKQNGSVRRVSVVQSLPQSLEDISTEHLIQGNSTDNSEDERCSSRKHSTSQAEDGIWNHRPSEFKIRDQLFSFFQASDNKLAMKLFGSRNALLKEKQRQMAAKSWIIHPCSNFR